MQRISVIENISLAYELGSKTLSEKQNEEIYGILPGHQVRGQNLRISVDWRAGGSADEALSFKVKTKKKLNEWDHSFLNEKKEYSSARPVTLETLVQLLWVALVTEDLLAVRIEQGAWAVERTAEMKADEVNICYRTRFQSLLKAQKYIPLDFEMRLRWSGDVGKYGVVAPWSQLKSQIVESQATLSQADSEFFGTDQVEKFLGRVAKIIQGTSLPEDNRLKLNSVSFTDPKDLWAVVFEA